MVTSISGTTAATTSAVSGKSTGFSGSGGDFETFLRMLTTQIQNQDPLNPMESTEFAVQLATFSGVEQQALTNSLLKEMLGNSSGGTLASVAGWIGKEVRTTGPVLFDGSPVTLDIEPAAEADAVSLVVLDAQGKEVSRTSIGTGSGEVDWQGRGDDGALLASGLYQFRVESSKGGTVLSTEDAAAYGMVTGAKLENGAAQLVLAGGATVAAEDVTGIRNAKG